METQARQELQPDVILRTAEGRREAPSREHDDAARRMFDRIAPTYDLANRVMSLGVDRMWRGAAVELLASRATSGPLLDLCAGTLDLSVLLEQRFPGNRPKIAADFSRAMLAAGRAKVSPQVRLLVADACALPFRTSSLGAVICGFGIRNVGDPIEGLREIFRTLRPAGAIVVLEFFRPMRKRSKLFHQVYANAVIPTLGRALSKDEEAYQYLVRSMRGFYARHEFEESMRDIGFVNVEGTDLTLGVASMICGTKPPENTEPTASAEEPLCCPACKTPLVQTSSRALVCQQCSMKYEIHDGIYALRP